MRALRWLVLALATLAALACSGVSDLPDSKPEQMFDAPGGPTPDARTVDGGTPDAPAVDAPPVDAAPDA